MTLIKCPKCQVIFPVQPGNTDVVHTCNSGISALDNEDILNLEPRQWNLQGKANKSSTRARVAANADVETRTNRGARKSTHRTRQHEEFIEL